jgi:hypothetical protein
VLVDPAEARPEDGLFLDHRLSPQRYTSSGSGYIPGIVDDGRGAGERAVFSVDGL